MVLFVFCGWNCRVESSQPRRTEGGPLRQAYEGTSSACFAGSTTSAYEELCEISVHGGRLIVNHLVNVHGYFDWIHKYFVAKDWSIWEYFRSLLVN
jgi:hypothetical protein